MVENPLLPLPPKVHTALLDLHRLAPTLDGPGLYLAAIEIATAVTDSGIGYFHLVNEDQETIELGAWTKATLLHCSASYQRHYPISDAGVWADSARSRQPCMHNDYQSLPVKRGYPSGHAHLVRHLGVPVIAGNQVVLLVGVGNKATDYHAEDLACLQAVANEAWALISQQRQKASLLIAETQLHDLQEFGAICIWHWDAEEQQLVCDANFDRIFGATAAAQVDFSLETLLRFIDVRDHSVVLDLLRDPRADTTFNIYVRGFRADGAAIMLNFRGASYPRSQGRGILLRGIFQDATARRDIGTAGYHTTHDPLTGLANLAFLIAQLKTRLHSNNCDDTFAVLYVNLDQFKVINDSFGHSIGDEVLKVFAGRLLRAAGKEQLVARAGGDELVVLQNSVTTPEALESLSASIIESIKRPIDIAGHVIEIGASVGIALASPGVETSKDLLSRAEHAMQQAKSNERGICRIA
jgi:diguanylate cyclase (GGDEF)-like protein